MKHHLVWEFVLGLCWKKLLGIHEQIEKQGLDLLKNLPQGPLAAVVVIGPYRSGKSFLMNQLLEVECDMGFGVGHGRETFTKGIWIWKQPRTVQVEGQVRNLLFVDTGSELY